LFGGLFDGDGGDRENGAAAALAHRGEDAAYHANSAEKIEFKGVLSGFVAEGVEVSCGRTTCIGYEEIDSTEF